MGSPQAPYLNSLIAAYGLATNYFGVAHPSQPNYLALFSGSTQGVTDDGSHDLAGTNLVDQLEAAHKTWSVFAQDYPGGCFTGSTKAGSGEGIGKAGSYARKHNPAISFTDISSNPARCAHIASLAAFDPAAADFELIVPNQCNDMHSCPMADGDAFLSTFVPRDHLEPGLRQQRPVHHHRRRHVEPGRRRAGRDNRGQPARASPGFTSCVRHDHYSLLRTIEDAWGLACLGQACSATNMAEFFR